MSDRDNNLKLNKVAETYARSLFHLAEQGQQVDTIHDQLSEVVQLLDEQPGLHQLFVHKAIDPQRRAQSIERIFEGRAEDLLVRFLLVLNEQQRLDQLPVIGYAYDQIIKASRNQVDVTVLTAQALEPTQRDAVAERLTGALGREAIVHTRTEPALIGGLRILFEDKLIDASVASQLRRMAQQIAANGHETIREAAGRLLLETDNGHTAYAEAEPEADVGAKLGGGFDRSDEA